TNANVRKELDLEDSMGCFAIFRNDCIINSVRCGTRSAGACARPERPRREYPAGSDTCADGAATAAHSFHDGAAANRCAAYLRRGPLWQSRDYRNPERHGIDAIKLDSGR